MMSEHKSDDLTATGTHRAWTSEPVGPVVRAGAPPETQRNWLERRQTASSRHAAITRSLNSWSSYKSWTDRMRHQWEKDKKEK